jgi:hypothetical protein
LGLMMKGTLRENSDSFVDENDGRSISQSGHTTCYKIS